MPDKPMLEAGEQPGGKGGRWSMGSLSYEASNTSHKDQQTATLKVATAQI